MDFRIGTALSLGGHSLLGGESAAVSPAFKEIYYIENELMNHKDSASRLRR